MDTLGYTDARETLARLGALSGEVILVGGQAVNFWAEAYLARSPELRREAPFASKDIDFCGSVAQAEACARVLGGNCRVFGPDQLTRRQAVVRYLDGHKRELDIDFLSHPFGVDADEVRSLAVAVQVGPATPKPVVCRVMHPIHVLESRACNVSELPNYRTEKGLRQLRAAVICAREFGRDLLESGRVRDVLRLNERVFSFSLRESGLDVWLQDGISLSDAIVRDPRLPEAFERIRFPQMLRELEVRREAAAEQAYRSGTVGVYVFAGHELRGNSLVAKLRAADGSVRELEGYRPGSSTVREGDVVRCRGDGLEVLASALDRARARGR